MAPPAKVVPEFPGFGVQYEVSANPFFEAICVENLRKLKTCDVGKELLKLIADAKPSHRADYPIGINVMMVPKEVVYVQSGFKTAWAASGGMTKTLEKSGLDIHNAQKEHSPPGCPFYIVGGSQNAAKSPPHSTNGTGSVCTMYFTNTQITTSKGESTVPFIVLAHELIHSYHCLYGIKKDAGEEEWATGVGIYAGERISENAFRSALGFKLRLSYY